MSDHGEPLPTNARLSKGQRASAMLEFDDGSRMMVLQATELRVVQSDRRLPDGGSMVELELLRGGLENMVTPRVRPPETRFEIRTPAAVAAVRGTQFRVHADDRATWTEVLGDAVRVGNAAGEVRADAGFGTVAGHAPEPPRPLLAAPDLSGLPERLERLPIDELKIDRSFVQDVGTDVDDTAIVRAKIALAHELGIQVVAEGVETQQQSAFLCAQSCDVVRGFLYGRPQPLGQTTPLL